MQEFILSCWTLNLATVNNFLFCVMLTNELSSASSENCPVRAACSRKSELGEAHSARKRTFIQLIIVWRFFFFNGAHRLIVSAAENNQLLSCGDSFQMRTPGLL